MLNWAHLPLSLGLTYEKGDLEGLEDYCLLKLEPILLPLL